MRRIAPKLIALLLAISAAGSAEAATQTLYQATNPGPLPAFSNIDEGAVLYDDIPVPPDRFPGAISFSITRITVRLYAPHAGTYKIDAYLAPPQILDGKLAPGTPDTRILPDVTFQQDYQAPRDVVIGDGATELFRAPLNYLVTMASGSKFKLFFFGLAFNKPLNDVGWMVADGPDYNIPGFYRYFGVADARTGPGSLGQTFWPGYNVILEGNPIVPEPSSILALGSWVGALWLSRRRNRR